MDELKENLKTLLRKAINNAKDGDEKGEWITINGTHVFIPEGKTAKDVIKEKGWEEKGEGKEKSEGNENKHGFKKDKDSGYYMKDLSDGTSVYVEKKEGGQGEKEPFYLEATHFDKDGKEISKKQYHYDSMDGMFSKIDRDFGSKDNPKEDKPKANEGLVLGDLNNIKVNINPHKEGKSSGGKKERKIKNGLSEIIKNCKPETKEDLKVLKGLKDILEEQ